MKQEETKPYASIQQNLELLSTTTIYKYVLVLIKTFVTITISITMAITMMMKTRNATNNHQRAKMTITASTIESHTKIMTK